MKRIAIILLTLTYILSVSGVSGSNFYCCGKYKDTYLFSHFENNKNCKKKEANSKCCDNKFFFVKVKDNHSPAHSLKVNVDVVKVLYTSSDCIYDFNKTFEKSIESIFLSSNPPPDKLPVYLSNKSFLI